jgi:iron complex outermembrane recepter protein
MGKSRNFLMLLMLLCIGSITAFGQEKRTVSGTVQDSTGTAMGGVTVAVKGTQTATATDAGGHFKIQATSGSVLIFSAVGYASHEVTVGSKSDFNIALHASNTSLNEVVVTSLGIRKATRSLGYAVSSISAKDITESGNTNFASALYGKAAGVRVTTAPGGASSAVNLQIRGVSSISLNTQPLYVVDGVPIRLYNDLDGNLGNNSNNQGFYSNQRIQANGVLDINPEDIENITILKGASASALYGSEATNGVVVITTKKGIKGKGMGVDFNIVANVEKLATSPDFQNQYGPGYDPQTNTAIGSTWDGWIDSASKNIHPYWGAQYNFGPRFDGRQVQYWDGSYQPYVAYPNNYKDLFSTGYNTSENIAFSNANDKGNYRFSYTRNDYKSIMPGSNLNKNNFNFNGTLKMSDNVSLDLVSTYNNNFTHNRPYLMSQIFASSNGWFTRGDNMQTYFNKYQTTDGYKYVLPNNNSYDQDQQLTYYPSAPNLLDYLWTALKNNYNETQNRFINSLTLNIGLLKDLKIRGRVGDDYTNLGIVEQDHNTQPAVVGYTGYYGVTSNSFNIFYGDAMAIYNPRINKDLGLTLTGGFTGRKQLYRLQNTNTGSNNGLVDENFFSLSNSSGQLSATGYYEEQVDVAGFGMLDLNYKNVLYLEGTGRYESTSTLPPSDNKYFYPSFNGGFILSDVVKLPEVINYAKLRASYGLVGNHPNIYQSNVGYTQNSLSYGSGNVLYTNANSSNFGNNDIKSEKKREAEFGLETRVFNDRLGLDLSYYNNKVMNQILTLSTAASTGSTSALENAGDLENYGVEAALNFLAIKRRDFRWNTRFNFAVNRNKLTSLPAGQTNLISSSQDGGYLILRADVGSPLGNIYVHPMQTDDKGNAVITNGLYNPNTNAYQYVGNILPKIVGGFSNSFSYRQFSLDLTIDYRFGGKLVSIPTYYMVGAGMYKNTLKYRDAAHGGLGYDVVSDATATYTADANGARHDGMILKGVTPTGAANTQVITAAMFYENTWDWETNGLYQNAVFDNSYVKLREATFSYNLPNGIASRLHFQSLSLAAIARNLFFIYRTLPHNLDPEAVVGSAWYSQGIDGGSAPPTRSYGLSLRARF